MTSSLILTERPRDRNELDYRYDEYLAENTPATGRNEPKVKGRIVTTLHKAKEVRPYVERCITVAKKALKHLREAEQYATNAKPNTDAYKTWRKSDEWQKWNAAIAPALAARRRAVQLIGNQRAVEILFDEIAPRFEDRDGGYTRILKLAKPRLGDAGAQAILEFVGNERDRVKIESERPAFDSDDSDEEATASDASDATQDEASEPESDASAVDGGETASAEETASDESNAEEDDKAKD